MIDYSKSPSLNRGVGEGLDDLLRSWGLGYLARDGAQLDADQRLASASPAARAAVAPARMGDQK